ncbi:MAG: quinolinate synthase NadA, partial [Chloroflexales bacterium]
GCVSSSLHYLATGKLSAAGTHILSTEGMIRHAAASASTQFVVATEIGVLHRMRKANPTKAFLPVDESISCKYMKLITLAKVRDSLRDLTHVVTVEPELAARARTAIERMIAL